VWPLQANGTDAGAHRRRLRALVAAGATAPARIQRQPVGWLAVVSGRCVALLRPSQLRGSHALCSSAICNSLTELLSSPHIQVDHPRIAVAKADVVEEAALAVRFLVSSFPKLVLVDGGYFPTVRAYTGCVWKAHSFHLPDCSMLVPSLSWQIIV
jgi:hypothetical protein